jgi:hypothetical protein
MFNRGILFLGVGFLAGMAIMTQVAEASIVGARPYLSAAAVLFFLALALRD